MSAHAARTGGRAGGSNFSTYSSPKFSRFSSRTPSRTHYPSRVHSFFFPGYGLGYAVGGPSIFNIIFYAAIAYLLYTAFQRFNSSEDNYDDEDGYVAESASVCKVQVGLLGLARSLQSDLDNIAQRADTSSPEGLHFLLQGLAASVLTCPSCVHRDFVGLEQES